MRNEIEKLKTTESKTTSDKLTIEEKLQYLIGSVVQ